MSATLQTSPDVVDTILGVREGDAIDVIRRSRPAARENTQATVTALFAPAPERLADFPLQERLAVASFVVALHGDSPLQEVYDADLEPAQRARIAAQAAAAVRPGPFGAYREPGLAPESVEGERYEAPSDELGEKLAAALTHAALLVQRPRESRPEALEALLDAGWSRPAVVTLSQLVAFLTYQVRIVAGLAVLKESQL